MADDDGPRLPLEEVLRGMKIHALPKDWVALDAFVLVKAIDENGSSGWCYRTTSTPNREELLGALSVQVEVLKEELIADWSDDDDE